MSVTSESEPLFTLLRLVLCIFMLNVYLVKKLLVVFAEFLRNDYVIVIDEIFLLAYRVIIDEPHTGNHERIERRNDYRADAEREKEHRNGKVNVKHRDGKIRRKHLPEIFLARKQSLSERLFRLHSADYHIRRNAA